MFQPWVFASNLGLCAAAVMAAAFVRPGKAEAVGIAICLMVNFVFCAAAYTPYAPKYALLALGIKATSKDLWLFADGLQATVAVIAFRRTWWWQLYVFANAQVALHVAYRVWSFDDTLYTDLLQMLLFAQLAVFYIEGGPGAVDFGRSLARRCWRWCHCMVAPSSIPTGQASAR